MKHTPRSSSSGGGVNPILEFATGIFLQDPKATARSTNLSTFCSLTLPKNQSFFFSAPSFFIRFLSVPRHARFLFAHTSLLAWNLQAVCRLGIHFTKFLLLKFPAASLFCLFQLFVCVRARHCRFVAARRDRSCGGGGGGRGGSEQQQGMDLSGTQGELPMAMHAGGGGGGSPYLGLHHGHHEHNHGANGRHMSPPDVAAEEAKNRQLAVVPVVGGAEGGLGGAAGGVRYRECLKNHAAAIGGSATDGCGEFMPAGEEGSLDALRCSACGCHRNFHRKEPPGGVGGGGDFARHLHGHHHHPLSPLAAAHHHHRGLLVAALPPAPTRMVMPLSAMHHHQPPQQHHQSSASAESDDAHAPGPGPGPMAHGHGQQPPARKRFRTKFTAEQKARMLGFAEEAGWRLQKLDDAAVQRFCQEVGVKRRVLKVWMHNNKHTLARRGGGHVDGDPHQGGQQLGMPLPEPGGHGRSPSRSPPPPPQQQLRLD